MELLFAVPKEHEIIIICKWKERTEKENISSFVLVFAFSFHFVDQKRGGVFLLGFPFILGCAKLSVKCNYSLSAVINLFHVFPVERVLMNFLGSSDFHLCSLHISVVDASGTLCYYKQSLYNCLHCMIFSEEFSQLGGFSMESGSYFDCGSVSMPFIRYLLKENDVG